MELKKGARVWVLKGSAFEVESVIRAMCRDLAKEKNRLQQDANAAQELMLRLGDELKPTDREQLGRRIRSASRRIPSIEISLRGYHKLLLGEFAEGIEECYK